MFGKEKVTIYKLLEEQNENIQKLQQDVKNLEEYNKEHTKIRDYYNDEFWFLNNPPQFKKGDKVYIQSIYNEEKYIPYNEYRVINIIRVYASSNKYPSICYQSNSYKYKLLNDKYEKVDFTDNIYSVLKLVEEKK